MRIKVGTLRRIIRKSQRLNEVAPPGREDQVKALKGKVDNPYAVAWAQHNKHGKPQNELHEDDEDFGSMRHPWMGKEVETHDGVGKVIDYHSAEKMFQVQIPGKYGTEWYDANNVELVSLNEDDEDGWGAGDVARVGIDDESFMIDPNDDNEWDLVPGGITGDNKAYSLNRDESGDYEVPVGMGIEDYSEDYSYMYDDEPDEYDMVARSQRRDNLQRENLIKITVRQLRHIIKEEASNQKLYVLERSGVSWSQKFFVSSNKWGSPEQAKKFKSRDAAASAGKQVEQQTGISVRVKPYQK